MPKSRFSLFRRKQIFARSAERRVCQIDCELILTDSTVTYEGRLINISAGGAMFRPRLSYLMIRRDVAVELRAGQTVIAGEIITTTPAGFGIRFEGVQDERIVAEVLATEQGHLPSIAA